MSYDDYRSGRPPTSTRPSASAYDSIAPRSDDTYSRSSSYREQISPHNDLPRNNSRGQDSRTDSHDRNSSLNRQSSAGYSTNSDSVTPSVRGTFASSTLSTNGKVENPYMTEAYASARGSSRNYSDIGGGIGGGGMDYYHSSKQKGNMQGKLKDTLKSTMAAAKQDNWKIVCVKATNHDFAAPKGKHVRVIMEGLRWGGSISNRESPAGGIFYHLRKRMSATEWVVVLKAQTIFHHIFRDGNEKFVEYIAANARAMFKMDFFADGSTEGISHMAFIKSYGAYVEQWLTMKAAVRFPPGKSKEGDATITGRYKQSPVEELLAALPVIMDTVESLLSLDFSGPTKQTPPAKPAISMVLRDMTLFWITLSEGMIRLLELFFSLDPEKASISLDVYKRFVALVAKAEPFFEAAKSMNSNWQAPRISGISLELMESMQHYIENGPEEPKEPEFSDEEQYDPEPEPEPEPVPEEYYEPEPEYYSEEEPEPLPPPPPRPMTPPSSTESSETESEEESSSEEEDETDELPTAPEPAPVPKAFDPLADLLGIESGIGNMNVQNQNPQQTMALQVYGAGGLAPGMYQPASVEQTVQDRVNNVKGIMAATAGTGNSQSGFGVNGTNMQVAMHGGPQAHQQQQQQQQQMQAQQMYNTMAMQRQQQMVAYQTMAAYQSMAQNPQMALYQMQQQSMANGMNNMNGMQGMGGMHRMGMMATYTPVPQGNQSVPVMQAENHVSQAGNYRVQKGTKPSRVNDDDKAFGPLLDQMKKTGLSK